MTIGIIGLGLIGGSLAKAIKKNTNHLVLGYDIDESVVLSAIEQEAIDDKFTPELMKKCDIIILGLFPDTTISFIKENIDNFKVGGIVIDTCGVKGEIVKQTDKLLNDKGIHFIGCHPMAGREFSGFDYSVDNLFEKASFIITETDNTDKEALNKLKNFALEIGFLKYVVTTPQEHDEIIAFTSQLAHIVSSSYIKSSTLLKQSGFSAGSFKDLTRVAKLNENMWTTLFLMNRDSLVKEIEYIINNLTDYKKAIIDNNSEELRSLLKNGRELKELSNNMDLIKS